MNTRIKLILSSLFALLLSGALLVHFSYAWIISNREINNITLKSGEGTVDFKGFIYKSTHEGFTIGIDEDSLIQATGGLDPNTGYLNFNFGGTISSSLLYGELSGDEHSLNSAAIPTFFIEIQAHTLVRASFVKINIQALSYAPNEVPFIYRYLAIDNDIHNAYSSAVLPYVNDISTLAPTKILDTTPHPLTTGAGAFNAYKIEIPSEATTDYSTYFVKSFVIAISLDPISLYNYLKTNANNGTLNNALSFNLSFRTNLEYSIGEFGA